jgi:hypothetical protein
MTMMVALGTLTPDLHDRGGDQDGQLVVGEVGHHGVLLGIGHLAVHQADARPISRRSDLARLLGVGQVADLGQSETRGQIQKAWGATGPRPCFSRPTISSMRGMGTARVATGVRPGGFSSMRLTRGRRTW